MDVYIHDGISSPFVPTWQSLALAPLVAILLAGLMICIRQRSVRPRQARFAGAAIVLLMAQLSPLMDMVRAFLVQRVGQSRQYGDPPLPSEIEAALFMTALIDATLGCVEIGLVLWALFGPEGGRRGRYLLEDASQTEPPCTGNNST